MTRAEVASCLLPNKNAALTFILLFVLNQRLLLNVNVVTSILTWFDLLRSKRKRAVIRMDVMEIDDDTFNLKMEGFVSQDTNTLFQPTQRKRNLPDSLRRNAVTVCLGLLCAVLLAANLGQLIYYARCPAENTHRSHDALTLEITQLEDRLNNLTKEKQQLQLSCIAMNISKNDIQTGYNLLQKDKEQLQTMYDSLQTDKEQLQTNYSSLANGCVLLAKQVRDKMLRTAVQIRSMPCQTGWRKFGDSCYIVSTEKKNWTSSRDDCSTVGADLVLIKSRKEQVFVNSLLASGQNAWIGMHDMLIEGNWTWVDGTPVTTTYWQDGQPNSYDGGQNCGEIVQRSRGGEWNDEGCSAIQSFICEQ